MKALKYLFAILCLTAASCTDDIVEPAVEDDKEPIPIGTPPPNP
ncbi:MAG TPA: hypothetical protein VKZ75_03935 [Cyclobacteriaceae bacterium]|nr:hypothetical protein [Cyclobacteriaceae bacterium]